MPSDQTPQEGSRANPGYAVWQIARALATSGTHEDAATRDRAREKESRWVAVLEGMLSGRLAIGARQPNPAAPLWATPEVVTGGFVTGRLLAGGDWQPHELALRERVGGAPEDLGREALNAWFLTDPGLAEMTARLRSGCYDVAVPEEGALLVVAWLAVNRHVAAAQTLIELLAPHFPSLRFYPIPAATPKPFGNRVHLEDIGETLERVRRIQPNPRILKQQEAILVWTPIYHRMVELFLETVEGDPPGIQPSASGEWVSPATGKFAVVGGWPCRRYAADWRERALGLVAECARRRSLHPLCGKPGRGGDSFARLRGYLEQCGRRPRSLTGRDVGMIRLILARHVGRAGGSDSMMRRLRDARQREQIARPMWHEIARVVQRRLAKYSAGEGLDALEAVAQPVTGEEAGHCQVPQGTSIPAPICRKLARCLSETAEVLVENGIITSGDTLAEITPQLTAEIRSAAFGDEDLRRLYAAIYRAFRRRRSLLLLNLEKQVRLEELPWLAAIEPFCRANLPVRESARRALQEVTSLTLRSFPQAIIPNKLLQELRALAQGAELTLPLVEELAADIFMNDFSPKFTEAAKRAAGLLEDSLYARYFAIDTAAVRALPPAPQEGKKERLPEAVANPFAELCIARAGVSAEGWDVVRNGMVIEQAQILTTQNLAVLYQVLELAGPLRGELSSMAERCFRWICRRQQMKSRHGHGTLIMLKNTAYAWRQMIFFLALLPEDEVTGFLAWAGECLGEQTEGFCLRFAPALRGLARAHAGRSLSDQQEGGQSARPFLGWTKGRHWILGEEPRKTVI